MQRALEEAKRAQDQGEVPIGAVLTDENGEILACAHNQTRTLNDPTAHAEILAIREGCKKRGAQRIPGTTLYITLEPCAMCAAALSFARVQKIIFAASDPKGGGILHGGEFYKQPTCHHKPSISYGLMEQECGTILKEFFKSKRLHSKP